MNRERYANHYGIPGWKQEKLQNAYVSIVGGASAPALMSFLAGGSAALGIEKILLTGGIIGDARIFGFKGDIENYIAHLNDNVRVYSHNARISNKDIANEVFSETTSRKPQVIVDVSNSSESQYFCLEYGKRNNIPVFVGFSRVNGLSFFRNSGREPDKLGEIVFKTSEFDNENEGKLNSSILASIILDEMRKVLMPLKGDVESENLEYNNSDVPIYLDKNVLMVGAGGIGTFAGIGLALNGVRNLFIADFDAVEDRNLTRQILYYDYDKLANRKKSSILCFRLRDISDNFGTEKSNFISLEGRITPESLGFLEKHKIDVLLGCVDNLYTRAVLNMLAFKRGIPYIDGRTGKFTSRVFTYVPGKTACLDCQFLGSLKGDAIKELQAKKEGKKKQREHDCIIDPSLLPPNQIAGTLMVQRLRRLEKPPLTMSFLSGDGIRPRRTEDRCRGGCNPYLTLNEIENGDK
ncbi:hypothetical protein A3K73_00805 [Candidatus Pacearchaeota archaeon RBG_13_36_9]|nr:MAG: hypothetical protein A3K73_00805 [Candidatus Pacearchaeota archaeon RBG_13_36_9]